jgi:hypothetical protein
MGGNAISPERYLETGDAHDEHLYKNMSCFGTFTKTFVTNSFRQLNITDYNGLVNIVTPFASQGCIRETQTSVYENGKQAKFVF